MRKLTSAVFISLDGVMQAPGGPEEDPTSDFRFGGWVAPFWDEEMGPATSLGDLRAAARKYLERVQELVGVQVGVVSVGPGREQTLVVHD